MRRQKRGDLTTTDHRLSRTVFILFLLCSYSSDSFLAEGGPCEVCLANAKAMEGLPPAPKHRTAPLTLSLSAPHGQINISAAVRDTIHSIIKQGDAVNDLFSGPQMVMERELEMYLFPRFQTWVAQREAGRAGEAQGQPGPPSPAKLGWARLRKLEKTTPVVASSRG
jgi:hypothetical protein